ncbi:MAG: GNAT family N-acetyltransferase [Paludibacteraceae bacterium]|nr:GNAT family N-acetyltransferase [Paludibacteraceae bacterium]
MKEVIAPVERELLKKELKQRFFLRPTNKAGNMIYDITAHDAPNVMREIARLREISYRKGGGSTGNEMDMDEMDTMKKPYRQIVVWDPDNEEIVGGYRYLCGADAQLDAQGQPIITSAHLFYYTNYFVQDYLPHTIELGRAFVQPKYQDRDMGAKALYALDNVWDGIGAVLYRHPEIYYLIGKVTIYPSFEATSRDLIYAYLQRYHRDRKGLFRPYKPVDISPTAQRIADEIFVGDDERLNYSVLLHTLRERGEVIPPMFSAYMNLTHTLQFFGNAVNDELANAYETGILVTVNDINEDKRARYIGVYITYLHETAISRRCRRGDGQQTFDYHRGW